MTELTARQREYREVYLRSEHWQEMRAGALERAEHRCQVCSSTKQLDVHHNTYERIGEERPADLLVLCRRCHDLFHSGAYVRPTKPKVKASKPKPKKQKQKKGKQPAQRKQFQKLAADNNRLHRIQAENRERQEAARRAREGRIAA